MATKYQEIYQRSIQDAEGFWSEVANDIFWYKKPTKILNSDNPPFYNGFRMELQTPVTMQLIYTLKMEGRKDCHYL